MSTSTYHDLSAEPSLIRQLTPDQKSRLTALLDDYLQALDEGMRPDASALAAENPDLAEALTAYISHLKALHNVAIGFQNKADETPKRLAVGAVGNEKQLGDFLLHREIGRGGMGVVYEATQQSLGRRVALKLLPFAAVLNHRQIARFKNEAHAAAQIQHANIVPIYGIGSDRGVHYYAMQFIDGLSLDLVIQELTQHKQQTQSNELSAGIACPSSLLAAEKNSRSEYYRTVVRLGIQAAEAIHAAHEYGVVHRDIKPSNLMLDHDGKLWITDFGLAHSQSDATLTRSGDVMGTVRYMSPEQALGKTAMVDHRTDVYSLGITLYELLTRHAAFPGENLQAVQRNIETVDPPTLRSIRDDVPVDLETVVHKAMSKERDDRYETAEQLAQDLQRFLDGRPTIARPPTVLDRVTKWSRRHRKAVTIGTCVSLLLAVGFAVSTLLVARANWVADQNLQQAQTIYQQARGVIDLGASFAEQLREIDDAQVAREYFLQRLLAYYEGFANQTSRDSALRLDYAINYSKIGTIRRQLREYHSAVEAYKSAVEILQQLCGEQPTNLAHARYLALAFSNLGMLHTELGQLQPARASYESALTIQDRLASQEPNSSIYRADLSRTRMNLGLLQIQTGDRAGAQDSYHSAIRLQRGLVQQEPDSQQHRRDLATTYNNLASLLSPTDPNQSASAYQQALNTYDELVDEFGPSQDLLKNQALLHNNLGTIYAQQNKLDVAEQQHRVAIQIRRRLTTMRPNFDRYEGDLALSYNNLGLVQHMSGRPHDSISSFKSALDLQRPLAERKPQSLQVQSSLGGMYNNVGIVLQELGKLETSATAFARASTAQRHALEAAPEFLQYREFLSKHYYNHAHVLRALERFHEAAAVTLKRKELWKRDPRRLISVAEELALTADSVAQIPAEQKQADKYALLAIATVDEAVAAGAMLGPDAQIDPQLRSLLKSFQSNRTDDS